MDMPDIVLTTLNARYAHSAFGLRCLYANMGDLRNRTVLRESIIKQDPLAIAEEILALHPRVVGLGVYVWNVAKATELVARIKEQAPEVTVVLGGPEVSHEWEEQRIVQQADYLIRGEGELAFPALCRDLLGGEAPQAKVIEGGLPDLGSLSWPYPHYDEEDIAQRVLYVEASRGCPFRCSFCLSSLDAKVRAFPLKPFLEQMDALLHRGALRFKFVDRTFNLDLLSSTAILSFFLERLRPGLFLHFEMVPDRFPQALRALIDRFPAGALQFEVGLQSLDSKVGQRIHRRQDMDATVDTLRYLSNLGRAHVHADLIVGLPGEDLPSFGRGFDTLLSMGPEEIQVGILKRLRGTALCDPDPAWELLFDTHPPYEILSTAALAAPDLLRMKRFARYWDRYANSGNFPRSLPKLWPEASPFWSFLAFSDWLFERFERDWGLSLDALTEALWVYLREVLGHGEERVGRLLWQDYHQGGRRPRAPPFLHAHASPSQTIQHRKKASPSRQSRHRMARDDQS